MHTMTKLQKYNAGNIIQHVHPLSLQGTSDHITPVGYLPMTPGHGGDPRQVSIRITLTFDHIKRHHIN